MEAKIFFQKFKLLARIGILEQELKNPQTIEIDLEFKISIDKAIKSDNIQDTVNYVEIKQTIELIVARQHYHLLETLAATLYTELTAKFSLSDLMLSIKKPEIFPEMQAVGIVLTADSTKNHAAAQ